MAINTQNIRIDLNPGRSIPVAFMHQNDTNRQLTFELYNNGVAYTPASGSTVKFAYKSPIVNGQYSVITGSQMASGTVSGNTVTATLPAQYTQVSGVGLLTMILTTSGNTLRPVNIKFVCQSSADGDDSVLGASDWPEGLYDYMDNWLAENEPTEIANLKSDLSSFYDIANTKSGTIASTNTWETVRYQIKSGRTYTIYNESSTATITVRTRATEDGTAVDSPSAIAPNGTVVFTATGDANYLRLISTGASTAWSIEENGTAIADLEADTQALKIGKLDVLQYKNETSETVTTANTFYNYPYTIRSGKTYICYAETVGNTMSFRTRATADGSNIDSLNAVAYGVPKSFVASADASFIRVNSYLPNGVFRIEETDTINYELNELKPTAPIVNLATKIYAVTGRQLNIYFDNIVENSEKYQYDVICSKGAQMERGFTITPTDSDAGTYTLQIDVYDGNEIVATATADLVISAANSGSESNKSFILLGDSTVNGTDQQIVNDFSGDVMGVSSLGTRGAEPSLNEGRTGWTFQYYYNSSAIGGIANPFYNTTSHLFDADFYFTNTGVSKPDWFFIQLGINDVFTITDDDALNSRINTCITQANHMAASIKSASSNTKIGIAITIPPNASQDAFGKAYGCGQTRNRYKRNNMLFVKRLLSEYSNRENENIYIVPIYTNLDTIYNMGLESIPVNARNTDITYQSPIANGGVHPVESGYKQLADVYMAFLKAQA